jgi:hypothetical protein
MRRRDTPPSMALRTCRPTAPICPVAEAMARQSWLRKGRENVGRAQMLPKQKSCVISLKRFSNSSAWAKVASMLSAPNNSRLICKPSAMRSAMVVDGGGWLVGDRVQLWCELSGLLEFCQSCTCGLEGGQGGIDASVAINLHQHLRNLGSA